MDWETEKLQSGNFSQRERERERVIPIRELPIREQQSACAIITISRHTTTH